MSNSQISVSSTFASFRHRNYRLWFAGQLVSLVGTFMQSTAQGYLVYTLTGSAAYLGYVGFMAGVPAWGLAVYGGLVADRMPRRSLLVITQAVQMLLAFVLAGLVVLNLVQPWHILVLALLLGVTNAFDAPARLALVADLVEREDMTNAIAFNATMFNTGLIVGPAIGAAVYALTGPAWCFFINGLSFIAVIVALLLMRIPARPPRVQRVAAWPAMVEGFRYVRGNPLVLTLVASVLVINVISFGPVTLLPAWAVKILGGDVTTNGLLVSARGAGAVLGGLLIAAIASRGGRGKWWGVSSLVMPVAMFAFAATRLLPLSLLFMAILGFVLVTVLNNSNAMVQANVPDELRGRVMGLYSLMFMGGGPLGSLLVGVLAEKTDEPFTFYVCAFATLIFALYVWFFRPEVRRMD